MLIAIIFTKLVPDNLMILLETIFISIFLLYDFFVVYGIDKRTKIET